jgi:hypothetical protein
MYTNKQFETLEAWVSAAARAAAEPTPDNTAAADKRLTEARNLLTRCCAGGAYFGHADDCLQPRI